MTENIKIMCLLVKNLIWSSIPSMLLYSITENLALSIILWAVTLVCEILPYVALNDEGTTKNNISVILIKYRFICKPWGDPEER